MNIRNPNPLYLAFLMILANSIDVLALEFLSISVTNPTMELRAKQTIALGWTEIKNRMPLVDTNKVDVLDSSGVSILIQVITGDAKAKEDSLIFQADFKAKETKRFYIVAQKSPIQINPKLTTYGRLYPERNSDFAWENDLIAFRMYGPGESANMTVNSGVDAWLKRVPYPILNKWYTPGYDYHTDIGEGHDPYHVGNSMGCGGLTLWENNAMVNSRVFDTSRVIANGPIRSVFELVYDNSWKVVGKSFVETKRISIDLGQMLFQFKSFFSKNGLPDSHTVAFGLTTHGGSAICSHDPNATWSGCWDKIADSELGSGVVVVSGSAQHKEFKTTNQDSAHDFFVSPTNKDGEVVYYTGYGWKKAGTITTAAQWNQYLGHFATLVKNPVRIDAMEACLGTPGKDAKCNTTAIGIKKGNLDEDRSVSIFDIRGRLLKIYSHGQPHIQRIMIP